MLSKKLIEIMICAKFWAYREYKVWVWYRLNRKFMNYDYRHFTFGKLRTLYFALVSSKSKIKVFYNDLEWIEKKI